MYDCPHADKNNPEALSQLYKMMNYKPTSNKGEKLTTEQVANFLKVNKKEGDTYDDVMYYDDAKIKVTVCSCRNWFWDRPSWSRRAILIPRSTSRQSKSTIWMTRPSTIKSKPCSTDPYPHLLPPFCFLLITTNKPELINSVVSWACKFK